MAEEYAEVVMGLGSLNLDQTFHYWIPEGLRGQIRPGQRVLVPLGSRKVTGIVLNLAEEAPVQPTREILGVVDPDWAIPGESLSLAREISSRYLAPLGAALELFLPPPGGSRRRKGSAPSEPAPPLAMPETSIPKLTSAQEAVLREVVASLRWGDTGEALSQQSPPFLRGGEPLAGTGGGEPEKIFLLHGVTGSGKTEIYLRAVEAAREKGRQSIVLVPEIALTPQLWERFRERFPGRVGLLHSRLSRGERYEQWQRVRQEQVDVVLGARSAVFAPVSRLGLVVLDEEHESTFKQEESPRYHARDVAIWRAKMWGATVILGSATPSLESYARAHRGEYRLLELPERIDHRPLPPVHVVDMKRELATGNRTIFSQPLREKITERLERREQVILFLNRRGHSTFVLCRECGFVARCPHCDIALTYHQEEGGLTCHYCGHAVPALDRCPVCRSPFFRYFGVGTEKVEREVERFFPESRTLRLDLDTTRRLGSHERILGAFAAGEADILIGTQMVAKGLDLPRVTLVGVVTADTALNLPDFRAAEKTFQILTQVAGRTGRGEKPGEVIVQTYAPDHYSIQAAAGHDYRRFWEREVAFRKPGGYPPFGRLINVIVASPKQEIARETAHQLGLILRGLLQEQGLSQRGGEVVCPGIPDGTGDALPSLTVVGDPALGDCLQTAVSAANPPGRPLGKDRSKSSRGKERQGSEARRTEWCVERGAAGRHVSAAGGCGGGTPPDIRGFSGTAGAAEGGRAPRAEAGGSPPDAQIDFFSGLLEEVAVSAQTDAGTGFGLANEGVVDPEVGEAFVFGIGSAQVLGPVPAPLARLRGNFRWQILLKGAEIDLLRGVLRRALSSRNWPARVRISVDVDPVSLL